MGITSGDGTVYTINSPIQGKLCELNDNLVKDLTLLTRKPGSNGYLAIVLHNTCTDDEFLDHLLTTTQYTNGESLPVRDDITTPERRKHSDVSKSNEVVEIVDPTPVIIDDHSTQQQQQQQQQQQRDENRKRG